MKSEDFEFHYILSYREGYGWSIASDVESELMSDGTIYDWGQQAWMVAWEDDEDEEIASIADLDTEHYRVIQSAVRLMNEGAINA